MQPIAIKLATISEFMSDGYKFIQLRFFLEEMERRSETGDTAANELCEVADRFLKLCKYVEKNV